MQSGTYIVRGDASCSTRYDYYTIYYKRRHSSWPHSVGYIIFEIINRIILSVNCVPFRGVALLGWVTPVRVQRLRAGTTVLVPTYTFTGPWPRAEGFTRARAHKTIARLRVNRTRRRRAMTRRTRAAGRTTDNNIIIPPYYYYIMSAVKFRRPRPVPPRNVGIMSVECITGGRYYRQAVDDDFVHSEIH